METSLHRALKQRYGPDAGGSAEVSVRGFRIDAVDGTGDLIEVQSGPLGPLRAKLTKLLPDHRVRVIKPIGTRRLVVRRSRVDRPDLSARLSPKRWQLFDVFEDLVGVATIFPHPNLTIEVLAATIEEVRVPRRRPPGYVVADRRLGAVQGSTTLAVASDLWRLVPPGWDWSEPFTTYDLAARLGRPLGFAQRIAYCLRLAGAARQVGKRRNRLVYEKA
jgi:hypothetical protein